MTRSPSDEGMRWLNQARADLLAVQTLLDGGRFDTACFLSQQSAEKTLKAYLYLCGEEMVLGHSVAKLCDLAAEYDGRFGDLKKEIKNLDQFYIEARYPNGLPDSFPAEFYQRSDAQWAIEAAQRAADLVEALWSTSGTPGNKQPDNNK
ncbi:MAG: HEPN domain-containing protein [Spirochaetia bacterium]